MTANYTRLDLRQTIERDTLQAATGAAGSLGDSVARGLNAEVTKPYYFTVTGSSLVLTVAGAGSIANSESLVSHLNAPVVGLVDPRQASFTITFPSTSGGTATSTTTIDSGATVTVASNDYINVGINLAANGHVALTYGTANASASAATLPEIPAGYWGIGYVQLFNNAGTIANLTNASLFHYDFMRYSQYLTASQTLNISSSITLTDNTVNFVDTSAARSLTLPAPSASSWIIIKDSTGSASTNNITLVRHGTEKIETVAASYTLGISKGSWCITSDGTDWFILSAWQGAALANPMTTTGDIIYSSDNLGDPARLAIGTNGQRLRAGSSTPTYSWDTINTVSTGYNITDTDGYDVISVTTGGSNTTIQLPAAANNTGRKIRIEKADTAGGYVKATSAGGSIVGTTVPYLSAQYGFMTYQSNGTNWRLVAYEENNYATVTLGATSASNTATWQYRRNMNTVDIQVTGPTYGYYLFFTKDGTNSAVTVGSLPKSITPNDTSDNVYTSKFVVFYNNGGTPTTGALADGIWNITAAGVLAIFRDVGEDVFGSGTQSQLGATVITYLII